MEKIKLLCILIVFLFSNMLFSQSMENVIENSISNLEDGQTADELSELLLQYINQKINLNTATNEDFENLFFLSDYKIKGILKHRETLGNFISLYELQTVPELDLNDVKLLIQFVSIPEQFSKSRKQLFMFRTFGSFNKKKGYTSEASPSEKYLGGKENYSIRYRYVSQKIKTGITIEKDAGEIAKVDFLSMYFSLNSNKYYKKIIFGDYQLHAGQGLLSSSGFFPGKGADLLTIRRMNSAITPYTSSIESGFYRGVAIQKEFKNFLFSPFISYKFEDAIQRTDSTITYYNTGLHRTQNEILAKNAVKISDIGSLLSYTKHWGQIGALAINRSAKDNTLAFSTFVDYSNRNISLFGEIGMSNATLAGTGGLLTTIAPTIDIGLYYRNLPSNFKTIQGNVFRENSDLSNEKGIFIGTTIKPFSMISITAWTDIFSFAKPTYFTKSASNGSEQMLRFNYKFKKMATFYLQYRQENKESDLDKGFNVKQKEEINRSYFTIHGECKPTHLVQLKSRIQWSKFKSVSTSYGFSFLIDYLVKVNPFQIGVRWANFSTDDYNARLYNYEKDIVYTFSLPAYYGKGTRTYLVLQYDLNKNIEMWCKIGVYNYYKTEKLGTGGESFYGNNKNEWKLLLLARF